MVAGLLLFRIGPAKEEEIISDITKRDPHFFAIQYPVVTVTPRDGTHTDYIRTGIGLRKAKGRNFLALRLRNKIFLLLLLGPPAIDAERIETDMHGHRHTQKRVARLKFLAHQPKRDVVKSRAAVFLWYADAHQPEVSHFVENGGLEIRFFVPFF